MLLTFFAVNHSAMSLGINASHETPDDVFRPATLTSLNCLPRNVIVLSMGNTAVLPSYLKHKQVMLLKCFMKTSIKFCLLVFFFIFGATRCKARHRC